MSPKQIFRFLLLIIITASIVAFFSYDLDQLLTLDNLRTQRLALQNYYQEQQTLVITIFALIYILVTALSLPGATIMTLAGGAVLGLGVGVIVISFASTIGATLAFLVSRFLLRDYIQNKFSQRLHAINQGIEREGVLYLFTLRLIPLFPFFVINLVMGLTPMRTWQYYLVSQIGMFPATIVYVNAGAQLGSIDSLAGILSLELLLSFALLGLFPLISKKLLDVYKRRKALRGFRKPKHFDFNLIVIGAGSAGLVSAYIASAVKAKVLLIEKHKMGGDCLNTGCVPSKALIRSAKQLSYAKRAKEFGFKQTNVEFSFAEVMRRVQDVIKKIEPHDSIERYTALGVDVIQGEANIKSPYEVDVNGKTYRGKNLIIATGAQAFVPDFTGLNQIDYLTSDSIWALQTCPRRLLVLGGGPIGCELAQSFERLGSQVTLVERGPRLLVREDQDVSELVLQQLKKDGINVLLNQSVTEFKLDNGQAYALTNQDGNIQEIAFDQVLIALGRKANVQGFGLENLNIELNPHGTIAADEFLRTNYPNIFVCGDVAGPYQFTHTAAHQAWYASVNALFGGLKKFRVDYSVIPWATFTDPEVARVGLNETEAKQKNMEYEITCYGLDDLDRAIADSEAYGFVKVLTVPGKDKILGVTIVGHRASDLIAEFVLAMKHNIGLNKILGTIHIYPTMAEANKFVAGNWKKSHAPEKLLRWVKKYHRWKR
ncbi:MAG: FAD-dependent oxidoreductase [Gammaproteobacteria bacterium]|nr:FAD-dependent oxidoreductase [Gammaproteobacteria bacterium]